MFSHEQRVRHNSYGTGTIVHSDEQRTSVQFDEHGLKKFVTRIVQLEATDVPAPSRPVRKSRKKTA